MSAKPKPRPGGRTAKTAEAAFAAALEELGERPFHAISFEVIAARSGVHRTTLYRRWGTPARLIGEALRAVAQVRIEVPDTGALDTDLRSLADAVAAVLRDPAGKATLLALLGATGASPEVAEVMREFWAARSEAIEPIVTRAVERGELSPGVEPAALFYALVAPLYFRALVVEQPITATVVRTAVSAALVGASADLFDRNR
jgi:AcrR family transcriptional regulator